MHLLTIDDLSISFESRARSTTAVKGISFHLDDNEILGIVGESGSGKSVTSMSIMGLIPTPPGKITADKVIYNGVDLLHLEDNVYRKYRGSEIAMIFQDPMTSLNPSHICGKQVDEMLRLHTDLDAKERKTKVLDLFEKVKLPQPERIYNAYPHELSGGQLQRIMIAMAISCNPRILIADEPTTALDVTVQKEILDLLKEIQKEIKNSIIFITHDLNLVKYFTDRVVVMRDGKIVESGHTESIFSNPKNVYTKGLIASIPPLDKKLFRLPTVSDFTEGKVYNPNLAKEPTAKPVVEDEVILEVKNVKLYYPTEINFWGKPTSHVKAVDDVSFTLRKGSCLGVVGESGCGKSSLAQVVMGLRRPTAGEVLFMGKNINEISNEELRKMRRDFQIIFQDPYSALNPRMTVGKAIIEPMKVHDLYGSGRERKERAINLLEKVGLSADDYDKYPHQFSGGQRQRICIARAMGLKPKFILCDESVSALDVSVQAQVLNLLKDFQEEYGLSYLFISHDLSVINFISDQVLVMQEGKIVESGDTKSIIHQPQHPYTEHLIASII